MTVSVAIATFNRARMVQQAVKAALEQSLEPLEVVVSDDASTDQTIERLEHWLASGMPAARAAVRILPHEVNSKGVVNWNQAMEATSGDYIAWCSDDDRFLPGHLEASVAFLAANPQVGLVHSGFVDILQNDRENDGQNNAQNDAQNDAQNQESWIREPRRLRSSEPIVVRRHNLLSYLIRYYDWPFHPSTIVMRREVWGSVGRFDPSYALADTDWFVRAAMQYPVALLPRHGVLNRRHPGNWSNQVGSARMQCEIYQIVDRAIAQIWRDHAVRRLFWRMLWRANVRARLALTIHARLRSGHGPAALAGWQALVRHTGGDYDEAGRTAGRVAAWIEKAGEVLIGRAVQYRERFWPQRGDSAANLRESVSPR